MQQQKRNRRNNNRRSGQKKQPPKPKFTSKISDHFSKKDFVCRCGSCGDAVKVSLGLVGGLELLRAKLKNRVYIKIGYMCQDAAEKQSLIKRNFHLVGVAADITVDNMDLKEVFLAAEEIPEFKGIGINFEDGHVHVDTRKADERETWIELEGKNVSLTDELRQKYIG